MQLFINACEILIIAWALRCTSKTGKTLSMNVLKITKKRHGNGRIPGDAVCHNCA
jgi:hypothetical protein